MDLVSEFKTNKDLKFEGQYKENYGKRLLALEHEFDGLIRRFLNVKFMYPDSGARNIDYMKFVTELQNKNDVLERQLERAQDKESDNYVRELDNLRFENDALRDTIRQKDQQIRHLEHQLRDDWGFISGRNDCGEYIASLLKKLEELKNRRPSM